MAQVAVSWELIAGGKQYPIYEMDPEKYPKAIGKANSWFQPLGPEPGRGWVLMARGDVLTILGLGSEQQKKLHLHLKETPVDGETEAADEEIVGVMIWRAGSVHEQGDTTDPNMLMLVELVDVTWLAEQGSIIGKSFNVRNPAPTGTDDADYFYSDTINSGSPYTYDSLCKAIWDGESTSDTNMSLQSLMQTEDNELEWPGLGSPNSVSGNPNDYTFPGVNRWQALHTILLHLFLSTARNPFTGEFRIVELGANQEGLEDAEEQAVNDGRLTYDSNPMLNYNLINPNLPAIYLNRNIADYGSPTDDSEFSGSNNSLITSSIQYWLAEVYNDAGGPVRNHDYPDVYGTTKQGSGYLQTITWDDLPGYYTDDETATIPGTGTKPMDRAGHLAAGLIQALEADSGRRIFSGFLPNMLPGEQIKAVWWRDFGDGFYTETLKYYGLPKRLVGPTGELSMDKQHEWGLGENLAPPDLARSGIRQTPRMCQLVTSNGDGTGVVGDQTVWVIDSSGVGSGYGVLGAVYLGRLSGAKSDTVTPESGDPYTLDAPLFTICSIGGLTCQTVVTSVSGGGVTTTTKNIPAGPMCS
jgi:hypothetical protein